jgi:hypothetical protein
LCGEDGSEIPAIIDVDSHQVEGDVEAGLWWLWRITSLLVMLKHTLAEGEVDPHLIVGDNETDLLAVVVVDPHLIVGDV